MTQNYTQKYCKIRILLLLVLFSNVIQAQTTTWNGSWDNNEPDSTKDVFFIANYTSTVNITAKSITVSNNAVVIIQGGISPHTLTVQDNISITGANSKLIFENNASLLQINASIINTDNIVYKRDANPMQQYEYTYWGSPVTNQTLVGFSPLTRSDRYYTFNADPLVNNYVSASPNNTMFPTTGYVIRAPENYTATKQTFNGEFVGTPNNGNYSASVNAYSLALKNSNLIGNPYPSAISIPSLYAANSNLGPMYFWTHKTGITNNVFTNADYAIRTQTSGTAAYLGDPIPGDYIAAGQGFFASSGTTGFINFNNSMRVANFNSQFFRTGNLSIQNPPLNYYFWLNMTNIGGAFKQMSLGYQDNATNGYDFGIDAGAAAGTSINFYSLIGNDAFAVQGRSYPWNINDVVPIGYSSTIADSFNISIDHTDAFFNTQDIFLEDTTLAVFHNLKNGSYNFNTAIGTFNSRFKIHYVNPTLSNNGFFTNSNSVYVTSKDNEIQINSTLIKIKNIQIYNILGQLLFEQKNSNLNKFFISKVAKQNQALIVKTELENGQIVSKKLIF
ncbi:T9SS sorting signal type C domain-containing protein [Flavobacterium sp.]|uniref:T9SS sorting signal type C domain-containing protein n=1 Tax=Flavobacterium sp. TaxID=239 RepID=UPI00286E0B61|nr:T9SS sorting signal type C domain-containing protein [Flavobacterium sp.]